MAGVWWVWLEESRIKLSHISTKLKLRQSLATLVVNKSCGQKAETEVVNKSCQQILGKRGCVLKF